MYLASSAAISSTCGAFIGTHEHVQKQVQDKLSLLAHALHTQQVLLQKTGTNQLLDPSNAALSYNVPLCDWHTLAISMLVSVPPFQ